MNKFEINHAEAVNLSIPEKYSKSLNCSTKLTPEGIVSINTYDNGLIITTIQYNDEIKLTYNKEIIKIDDTHYTIGD